MGTRSLIYVKESERSAAFLCIYRQFDGYPEGMGKDIHELLHGFKMTNGFTGGDATCAQCGKDAFEHRKLTHSFQPKRVANGMGCLAARLVQGLKDSVGNVYIYPPRTAKADQEYEYTLWLAKNVLMLQVVKPGWEGCKDTPGYPPAELYRGKLDDFTPEACKQAA